MAGATGLEPVWAEAGGFGDRCNRRYAKPLYNKDILSCKKELNPSFFLRNSILLINYSLLNKIAINIITKNFNKIKFFYVGEKKFSPTIIIIDPDDSSYLQCGLAPLE